MADLSTTIESAATGPKSVKTDSGSVVAQELSSLIAADQYLAQKAAAAAASGDGKFLGRALRFGRARPPGAV